MTLEQAPLFSSLTKRPAATTVTIRELIQKVQAGAIRIPNFQRPLRWTKAQVVELFDSLWRGYPIGSLLFWKRVAREEPIRVGGATFNAPAVNDAWWVVDGQQRTTALAASLLELDHAGDTRWQVHFDPEQEQFRSGEVAPERVGIDIPLADLGDIRRLSRWTRNYSPSDHHVERIEVAQQRILDYSIPAYIVETDDEKALRGVFARLNSTGARMRADEVFQALLGAPTTADESSLDLDHLQKACDLDGFGLPPRAEILKAVLAMSDLDPSRRLEQISDLELRKLVTKDDAISGLTRTVRFLIDVCGIPHVSLIPYPVVFFILCKWFHIHAGTDSTTRQMLARWLWRGASSGVHDRAEVSKMRDQVRSIQPGDEQRSLDRLLARVASTAGPKWQLHNFDLRSARSRMEVLALRALGPRDDLGPIEIKELIGSDRVAREIFSVAECKYPERALKLARTAANRVLLGSSRTGLHKQLKAWSQAGRVLELRSHLIDENSQQLLCQKDIDAFLSHRANCVCRQVDQFLQSKAAWNQPILRPTQFYLFDED